MFFDWSFYAVILVAAAGADALPDKQSPAPRVAKPMAPRPMTKEQSLLRDRLTADNIPANVSPPLRDAIEGTFSSDPIQRGKAAEAIGQIGDRAAPAAPFLIRLLTDDAKVGMRHVTVPKDIRFPPGEAIRDYDEPITVADRAVHAIFRIGKPSVEYCATALSTSSDAVRGRLMRILRSIKDPRAIEPIGACLDDSNPWLRNEAVRSFVLWNDPRVVPPVIRALKDENDEVRASAVWVAGSIRDARLVRPLTEALSDKDKSVRTGAERALRKQRGHD